MPEPTLTLWHLHLCHAPHFASIGLNDHSLHPQNPFPIQALHRSLTQPLAEPAFLGRCL